MNNSEISDEALAQKAQKGDKEAFGVLVRRYQEALLRYARRFLRDIEKAHELVQEVFIKAWINIVSFDTNRKFSSWLYRIAHNVFIDSIRASRSEPLPLFDTDTFFPHPIAKDGADVVVRDKETKKMIESGLNSLNAKYREVLILYYLNELEYQEIADILRIPVATVGVRLRRARMALRDALPPDALAYAS